MSAPPTPEQVAAALAWFRSHPAAADCIGADMPEPYADDHAITLVRAALAAPAEQPREDDSREHMRVQDAIEQRLRDAGYGDEAWFADVIDGAAEAALAAVPAVSAGRDLTAQDVQRAYDGTMRWEPIANYLNGIARSETVIAPTSWELRARLREIADEATRKEGILQPGAAYALGMLADLVRAQPGCLPEHVADAITATVESKGSWRAARRATRRAARGER
jgi:hypothetical protein